MIHDIWYKSFIDTALEKAIFNKQSRQLITADTVNAVCNYLAAVAVTGCLIVHQIFLEELFWISTTNKY